MNNINFKLSKISHIFIFICVMTTTSLAAGNEKRECRFEDYKTPLFEGKMKNLNTNTSFSKNYRSALREGLEVPIDYAGSYTVVDWGCGGYCMHGGIVDHKTGKAVEWPFWIISENVSEPLLHNAYSSLLIATGLFTSEQEEITTQCYIMEKNKFRKADECECPPPNLGYSIEED